MSSNCNNTLDSGTYLEAISRAAEEYRIRFAQGQTNPDFYVTILNRDGSPHARVRASNGQIEMFVPHTSTSASTTDK